jgi:hypothetical protein
MFEAMQVDVWQEETASPAHAKAIRISETSLSHMQTHLACASLS